MRKTKGEIWGILSASGAPTVTKWPPGRRRDKYSARGIFGSSASQSDPVAGGTLNEKARRTGGGNDQIQGSPVRLHCLFGIITSRNECSGTHLFRISLFALTVTNDGYVRSHGFGENNGEMTQTSKTDNSDILGLLASAVLDQGGVDGRSSTEHGGGFGGIKVGWNGNDESRRTSPVVCVSTE